MEVMDALPPADASTSAPPSLFKKRTTKSKTNFRKRAASPIEGASDSSGYSSSEDESGRRIKRRKRTTGVITASSTAKSAGIDDLTQAAHIATARTTIASSNDATKQSNWYDETSADALSSRNLLGNSRKLIGSTVESTDASTAAPHGTYKGLANATRFVSKNPNAPNRVVGPIKASTNIRTITVTDFAPDVCKDYKQTGFCGFGDNCKFLHAREDYKQGWQLDKEWESVTKGKKAMGGTKIASADRRGGDGELDEEEAENEKLEGIPFRCIICKSDYKDPIVTRCSHYFCEKCALQRYRNDPSCAACGAGTGGVFNVAKGLRKLLERKRERTTKKREMAIEAGEEVSSEDESEDT